MWKMLGLAALLAVTGWAQEENSRQIWKRPPQAPKPQQAPPPKVTYRPVGPAAPSSGDAAVLGVTLWRMRTVKAEDAKGARLLVLPKPGAKAAEKVPERVDPSVELSANDEVRLSVEVPSAGYLYVIDREQSKNGMSRPYLIYPNRLTPPGDNLVGPGRVLEIPDRRGDPNVFLVDAKPGQTAEVLSLVVSPEPIAGLKTDGEALELDPALYASWEKKWKVAAQRFDLAGGQGKAWTEQENEAGAGRGIRLTENDPLPQTMFKVSVKPGSGILVEVPLKIKQ